MKNTNWPRNVDLGHTNWTGRTPREASKTIRSNYKRAELEKLTADDVIGLIVMIAFIALLASAGLFFDF